MGPRYGSYLSKTVDTAAVAAHAVKDGGDLKLLLAQRPEQFAVLWCYDSIFSCDSGFYFVGLKYFVFFSIMQRISQCCCGEK